MFWVLGIAGLALAWIGLHAWMWTAAHRLEQAENAEPVGDLPGWADRWDQI